MTDGRPSGRRRGVPGARQADGSVPPFWPPFICASGRKAPRNARISSDEPEEASSRSRDSANASSSAGTPAIFPM